MPNKYEVTGSKLKVNYPLYVHTCFVTKINEPHVLSYPRGIYEPVLVTVYDVELDDGETVRMKQEFAENLKVGDEVFYNVVVDDFTKFDPSKYPVTLNLVV